MNSLETQIARAIDGRHPLIYVQIPEEDRVQRALEALAAEYLEDGAVYTWSCVDGLSMAAGDSDTRDPVDALRQIVADAQPGFYMFQIGRAHV